jgi:hypothetical protein
LEKLDFKNFKRYLGKSFGHILKANDMKHHISQLQPDLIILNAPYREMKTWGFLDGKIHSKIAVFSSHFWVLLKSSDQAGCDLNDATYH